MHRPWSRVASVSIPLFAFTIFAGAVLALAVSPGQSPASAAPLGVFTYTGGAQSFVVPEGVDCIAVDAVGAQGGQGENPDGYQAQGGLGGRAVANIDVTPGETLMVYVGGQGGTPGGGFNGGGDGGDADQEDGGGGGGASDVRRSPYGLADRLIVAGGGGGGGGDADGGGSDGGAGGGLVGGDGAPSNGGDEQNTPGGGGGTQTAGGLAPTAFDATATNGALGQGGQGGIGPSNDDAGAGGGGGYYGGGGGAGEDDDVPTDNGGGGGGGSGFGPPGTEFTTGFQGGNGAVEINPCSDIEFDWTVPDRFGFDKDGDGMTDYYAPSGQLVIEPDDWQVNFTHGDPASCDTNLRRDWFVDGQLVASTDPRAIGPWPDPDTAAPFDPNSCEFSYKFPDEGQYDVTLEVFDDGGDSLGAVTQEVVVQDWLIISIGDSVASGEGSPDLALTPTRTQATWQSERCHRSAYAGPALAAKGLEDADPKTSVTFVHLACSGADIVNGLLRQYNGIVNGPEPRPPAQIDHINQLVQSREIDAITLSIGANDVDFSGIVIRCVIWRDCHEGGAFRRFNRLAGNLPSRFDSLNTVMSLSLPDVAGDRIYITEYFDPTRYDDFSVCGSELGDGTMSPEMLSDHPSALFGLGVSAAEASWASLSLLQNLNGLVQTAATTHGWNYVDPIANLYRAGHGYCATDSWIVSWTQSVDLQGDENGTLHPNYSGQNVYGNTLRSALTEDLYENGDLSMPRLPAPAPAP